jgi:CTP:phosphocholine cytidylyltransferase-like protein
MIKAEIYQDTALLLDYQGRVWQVSIGSDNQPIMQEMVNWILSRETISELMQPQLARYVQRP